MFTAWAAAMPSGLNHGWVDSTGRDAAAWRAALRAETLRVAEEWLRREAEVRAMAAAARLGTLFTTLALTAIGTGPGAASVRACSRFTGISRMPAPASSLHIASLRFPSHLFASLRITPHLPGRAHEPQPSAWTALAAFVPPGHVWWMDVDDETTSGL